MFVVISVEVNNTHIREKPTQRLGRCFTELGFSRSEETYYCHARIRPPPLNFLTSYRIELKFGT